MTGRFAPTPSGRMHIGNVYALLAAWLSARAQGQPVRLRIEDLDRPRVVSDADRWIMDDLRWLGLDWDGEPVYQSQRGDAYALALSVLSSQMVTEGGRAAADGVIGHGDEMGIFTHDAGMSGGGVESTAAPVVGADCVCDGDAGTNHDGCHAAGHDRDMPLIYPCFCSRADIRAASAPQEGDGFSVYPGTCRRLLLRDAGQARSRLAGGARHALRIAVPDDGMTGDAVSFDDRVFGRQRMLLSRAVGDAIVRRSDGVVSYQLAVVVDDLLMGVDDIVRGRDLMRSTALQIWIRQRLLDGGFMQAAQEQGYAAPPATVGTDLPLAASDAVSAAATSVGPTGVAASADGSVGRIATAGHAAGHGRAGAAPETAATMSHALSMAAGVPAIGAPSSHHPSHAHLPLIDNAAGRRLAKRERSLDMGALRDAGVRARSVIGYCAWLMGLRDGARPVPMSPREAMEVFTWERVRRHAGDRRVPDDLVDVLSA